MLIEERLEAAREHRVAGREDSAALLYESVLDAAPANRDALKELARLKLNKGEIEVALRLARSAATQSTPDADALVIMATGALAMKKPAVALAALDQALAVEPHHARACCLRADLHVQNGEQAVAQDLLSRAMAHDPANPDLLAAMGGLYANAGIHVPALDLIQQALEREPDRPELLALLGSVLAGLGDHEKALPQLEQAYLAQPGNPLVMAQLADTLCALGQLTEAQRLTRRCITLFEGFLPGWVSHVRILVVQGRAKEGLAEFLPIARKHPDKVGALVALATCQRIAGYPEQALRLIEPLLARRDTLEPSNRNQIAVLARDCLLSLGRHDEIAKTVDRDLHEILGVESVPHGEAAAPDGDTQAALDASLAQALAGSGFVVDGGLSSLEALALLRFDPRRDSASEKIPVYSQPQLRDVVALVSHASALGMPPEQPDRPLLPLSMVLALPPALRGAVGDAVPYVVPSEERRALWRRSLAGLPRPIVALTWDANRPGLMLEDYRAVLDGFEGTLLSLSWDASRHQLAAWPEIIDGGVHFRSLADLPAAIAETDAVIGPDGLALHVAGAMGHPGLLLAMPGMPWYWRHEAGRAEWYPTISVLRSEAFGHWQERLPAMRGAIAAFLDSLARPHVSPSTLAEHGAAPALGTGDG